MKVRCFFKRCFKESWFCWFLNATYLILKIYFGRCGLLFFKTRSKWYSFHLRHNRGGTGRSQRTVDKVWSSRGEKTAPFFLLCSSHSCQYLPSSRSTDPDSKVWTLATAQQRMRPESADFQMSCRYLRLSSCFSAQRLCCGTESWDIDLPIGCKCRS